MRNSVSNESVNHRSNSVSNESVNHRSHTNNLISDRLVFSQFIYSFLQLYSALTSYFCLSASCISGSSSASQFLLVVCILAGLTMLPCLMYSGRLQFSKWIIISIFMVAVFPPVNATVTVSSDGNNGSVAVAANFKPERLQEVVEILRSIGYTSLANRISFISFIVGVRKDSVTLFAPSDSAFRMSFLDPSEDFSVTRLNHHIVKGVFTFRDLKRLSDGTQLETVAGDGRGLVITKANASASSSRHPRIFVNGVEVSHPDIYNDGFVIIHGINHFLAEAPPPLSFGTPRSAPAWPYGQFVPLVLQDSMVGLRDRGYSILALALRIKFLELRGLHSLTVFTLDDNSIFTPDGQAFVNNVRYHILPNKRLLYADLLSIPAGTVFDTLHEGQRLMVTSTNPFSINGVRLKNPDAFSNEWIVAHGVPAPFTFWW